MKDIQDFYPLSPMQEGLLFHSVSAPGSGMYNMQASCSLHGRLSTSAFGRAWEILIEEYPILRTGFLWQNIKRPIQVVHRRVSLPLQEHDWRGLPTGEAEHRLESLLASDQVRDFDLSQAPLFRIVLIRMADDVYHVIATFHHIIMDGWSSQLLIKNFTTLYHSLAKGENPVRPAHQPYREYIRWLKRQNMSDAEAFWRSTLNGFRASTPLPTIDRSYPRKSEDLSQYGFESITLPKETSAELREFGKRHRLTLSTIMQGAWSLLLSRYAATHDVVFGVMVSGRPSELPGIDSMIGLFMNTLPLRVGVPVNAELIPWLQDLQRQQVEARRFDYSPLAEIQKWSDVPRGAALFESSLEVDNFPHYDGLAQAQLRQKNTLEIRSYRSLTQMSLPLLLMVRPDQEINLQLRYQSARFQAEEVLKVLNNIKMVLEGMISQPACRLGALSLDTLEDRQRIIVDWNQTTVISQPDVCFQDLFEAQVERTPDRIALEFDDLSWSYAALNREAAELAQHLRALGVRDEVRVAIYAERGPAIIISELAVLKAGGTFVPVDSGWPARRVQFALDDTGAPIILTDPTLDIEAPIGTAQVIRVDGRQRLEPQAEISAESKPRPENSAYTIYTSGSTGLPKGVVVEHRGLRNLVEALRDRYGVDENVRMLQFAPFSFDASISEIFTPLITGATLVLGDRDSLRPGPDLLRMLRERRISMVTLPTSVLQVLEPDDLPDLETVITGGDVCTELITTRWGKQRRMLNAYGPTEITVWATVADCSKSGKPDIGRPIMNTQIYILDKALEPVPVGAPGEICIGGAGVARGYLNRPDLTAQAFIPNPFVDTQGARMYRTGDIGCYLPSGKIDFLGRADNQVKIMGYRIEPEEISAWLSQHPSVRQAIVVSVGEDADKRRLAAYVVMNDSISTAGSPELWPWVTEHFVYDDLFYGAMIHDERRNDSYRAALNRAAAGKVILNIGAGPEAVLARFCVEAGASKVYAIESHEESYRRAVESLHRLGLEDRVELIFSGIATVDLPEPVDLIVSELVGPIGGMDGAATILSGARRFLKPGGKMVPSRSVTRIAAVSLPEELIDHPAFTPISAPYVQKIFEAAGGPFDLRVCIKNFPATRLLSTVETFEDLDFNCEFGISFENEVSFRIERDGRFDGFLLWLNLDTGDGETIDALANQHCWWPVYFPAFSPGIQVSQGDLIKAVCSGAPGENRTYPDYAIRGEVIASETNNRRFEHNSKRRAGHFRGSAFYDRLFADGSVPLRRPTEGITEKLRDYLHQHLPPYMVPSAFVVMNDLPLTATGKIDRHALPDPSTSRAVTQQYIAPRTSLESKLSEIWSKVLNVQRVGIEDNFFALGGDSILSLQIVLEASSAGLQLTPRDVLERPTIVRLATVITSNHLLSSETEGSTSDVALTPFQRLCLEHEQALGERLTRCLLLRLRSPLSSGIFERALSALAEHHEALQLQLIRRFDGWAQILAEPDTFSVFHRIDLSAVPDEMRTPVLLQAASELRATLDLYGGPMWRIALIDYGEDPGRLLIVARELIADQASWRILVEDLSRTYEQIDAGREISLPPASLSFQRWVMRSAKQSPNLQAEMAFWQNVGAAPLAQLPIDHYDPDGPVRWNEVSVALESAETIALRQLTQDDRQRINNVLLAAITEALHGWMNDHVFRIDIERDARDDAGPESNSSRATGCFTIRYPIVLRLPEFGTMRDSLQHVNEQLHSVPRNGVSYGWLLKNEMGVEIPPLDLPQAEILFKELVSSEGSSRSALFEETDESRLFRRQRTPGGYSVEITSLVNDERLQIVWNYQESLYRQTTMEAVAARCLNAVRSALSSDSESAITSMDFGRTGLSRQELDRALAEVEFETEL